MPVSEREAANVLPPSGWVQRYVRHGYQQTTAPLVYHLFATVISRQLPLWFTISA
jgi:hypothetical protein